MSRDTLESSVRSLADIGTSSPTINRRDFLVTSIGAGFALAVTPAAAQSPITTSADGLRAGEVKIPVAGGDMVAYRAMPANGKNLPVVLVISEIFGVHEYIADVCRRFARAGYLALAPELFARYGDPRKLASPAEIIERIVSKVPDAEVMADLDAAATWARSNGGHAQQLGITGFCWGGRITWLYAAHNPALTAGVAWYGRIDGLATPLQPSYPLDLAARIKPPVLGLYGGRDQGIPLDDVDAMSSALAHAKAASMIHVYPEAPHAFHADYRPSFRKEAAEDGWRRALEWFMRHGLRPDAS